MSKVHWIGFGLGIFAIAILFYRYLVHDGDFDVYWAATFRYVHGLKIHIYEQNVFTSDLCFFHAVAGISPGLSEKSCFSPLMSFSCGRRLCLSA